MAGSDSREGRRSFAKRYWWLTMVRGVFAFGLGVSLLLTRSGSGITTLRFMAMYWFASGLLSISGGVSIARRPGLWLAIGVAELIAGMVTFFGSLSVSDSGLPSLLGAFCVFAILTGTLHIVAGIRIRQRRGRKWSWGSFFMGVLQIVLGVLVLASEESIRAGAFHAASIWAFIAGAGLISNALRLRRLAVVDEAEEKENTSPRDSAKAIQTERVNAGGYDGDRCA